MLTFSSAARKHEVSPVGYLLFPRPKEAKRYLLQPDYKGHRAHLHPGLASAEPERKSQQPFTKLPSITETKTEPLRSRRLFTLVALRRPTGWLLKWDGVGWGGRIPLASASGGGCAHGMGSTRLISRLSFQETSKKSRENAFLLHLYDGGK